VLKADADEEKAETARLSSFVGAMAVGDLVKSTLGPKGMDKILWGMGRNEGQVEVTNDGATILKAIGVDNPAAKVLVEMSKVQVGVKIVRIHLCSFSGQYYKTFFGTIYTLLV
jgi:T-complex protein 1 subunit beta